MFLTRPLRVIGALALTAVLGLQLTACDAIYEPGKVYLLDGLSYMTGINDAGVAVGTKPGYGGAVYDTKAQTTTVVRPPAGYGSLYFDDINDAGLAVGHLLAGPPQRDQAFVYNTKTGGLRVIQLPSGLTSTTSVGIDDVGRVLLRGWRYLGGTSMDRLGNYLYDHRDRSLHPLSELITGKLGTTKVEVTGISSDGILVGYGLGGWPAEMSFVFNWDRQTFARLPNTPGRTDYPAAAYALNRNGIAAGMDADCSRSFGGSCFQTQYVYDRRSKAIVSLKAGTPEGPVNGASDAGMLWGPTSGAFGDTGWWYDLAAKRGGAVPRPAGVTKGCVLAAVNDSRMGVGDCDGSNAFVYRVP